jgi:endogenous inhibitor of DNA gyrase (YacG/DUF329 family)
MENEFKLPDYYNITKPKSEEKLIKRKCFACGKQKEIGVFERYCSPECRAVARQYNTDTYRISW